jgi:hypothetical protein
MRTRIPAPVIAVVADTLSDSETHASMDSLFMYAGAPGDPPDGSKIVKAQEWLRRVNKDDSVQPLEVLGRLIEAIMEVDCDDRSWDDNCRDRVEKINRVLDRGGLRYQRGGRVLSGSLATPTKSLEDLVRDRDLPSLEEEFDRALKSIEASPRDAVSAACNILESVCKIYIQDEGLQMPKKKDLKKVWAVVRDDLNFDASAVEDRDLKEILSGLSAVAGGIGALRTHASTAHGAGRRSYRLEARHARLAVHAAHTLVAFVIESWDKKKAS